MVTLLTVIHIIVCIFLILVVLLQAGKGGGVGIAFGGGGSQTVFGSSGAGNFLTRLTSVTAFIFLVTSLGLSHYSSQQDSKRLQKLAERLERGALERLFQGLQGLVGVREEERATTFSFERQAPGAGAGDALVEHVSLDTSALAPGDYSLAVRVTDRVGRGTTVEVEREFTIGGD